MNSLLNAMKEVNNRKLTENGDTAYKSTLNEVYDLFAFGGSYRARSEDDCILLFKKAFDKDPTLALRCLFYLRDIRGGQGERRFFRTCLKWLANKHPETVRRNFEYIPEFGRFDDLYALVDTPVEKDMFHFMMRQLDSDLGSKTPSLLAKWLKSTSASSEDSKRLAYKTMDAFGMTPRQYRKTLSTLRERIKVVEKLMAENRWNEIDFSKLPSGAGFKYRKAFARKDMIKARYEAFARDENTKVNADTLNPCEVVHQAVRCFDRYLGDYTATTVDREMINKYWDNLKDYFNNAIFNGVAVVDTSGSMTWGDGSAINPIDVAISLGMYCAEKCNPRSPWYGHYISFSRNARLVPIEGIDFVDKVRRIYNAGLCENTNIESVFDLILNLAVQNRIPQSEMPENIVIISDMEFDMARYYGWDPSSYESVIEKCLRRYEAAGYKIPHLVFWNVNARNDTISMRDNGSVTFVSGYSPVTYEMLMSGKTGVDLMLDKLNSERYKVINV